MSSIARFSGGPTDLNLPELTEKDKSSLMKQINEGDMRAIRSLRGCFLVYCSCFYSLYFQGDFVTKDRWTRTYFTYEKTAWVFMSIMHHFADYVFFLTACMATNRIIAYFEQYERPNLFYHFPKIVLFRLARLLPPIVASLLIIGILVNLVGDGSNDALVRGCD